MLPAFAEQFRYMSENQYDRRNGYALGDSICPNGQMELTEESNEAIDQFSVLQRVNGSGKPIHSARNWGF